MSKTKLVEIFPAALFCVTSLEKQRSNILALGEQESGIFKLEFRNLDNFRLYYFQHMDQKPHTTLASRRNPPVSRSRGASMRGKYDHQKIEKKWQKIWEKEGIYQPDLRKARKPFYNLMMYPYPSAEGLHAGNMFAFTGSDVYGRFMRMQGLDVFEPIGLDGFGIHSENYALKIGKSPKEHSQISEKNFYRQLSTIGNGFAWQNRLETYDIDYYRWTQWLFVKMFQAGLAYRKNAKVNWCPSCKTVLADEQVIAGRCERCKSEVNIKNLSQWFFRITNYADRLLEGLSKIDWSERVVIAQRNWIGKSQGVTVDWGIKGIKGEKIATFTTRADTLYGATFLVLAPEHPLVAKYFAHGKDIMNYLSQVLVKSEQQRRMEEKQKSGVDTGFKAIHPLTKKEIPVWISDFVLGDVGTGAIMGVPAHDQRDWDFAKQHSLPIIEVIKGADPNKGAYDGEGELINSNNWNGLKMPADFQKIVSDLMQKKIAKKEISYHLRDWLISRQRYWGAPIPMIFCERCAKEGRSFFKGQSFKGLLHRNQSDWEHAGWWPVLEKDLPVELLDISDYRPEGTGKGPLANHPEFYKTKCPNCGAEAQRETDVCDTFLDSSWYFLRYPSVNAELESRRVKEQELPWDSKITEHWLPVDLYFGGAEHSVLHLMYARFMTMFLHDIGKLSFAEPFPHFFAHGLLIKDGAKMSKSRGNIVNPDEYITKFGADAFRLYLMFIGPMDSSPDFRDTGMEGMFRFVGRLWRLFTDSTIKKLTQDEEKEISIKLHQTIKKVTEDIQKFHYNTAISQLMTFINIVEQKGVNNKLKENLCLLLAPFAPHMMEEIWHTVLAKKSSIHTSTWPKHDPRKVNEEKTVIVIQVNGKVRSQMTIVSNRSKEKEEVINLAKKDERIVKWLKNEPKKTIFVPGKLINFVV